MAKKNEPDKLAQDAAAARAAGMTYGKWKALQPVVPIEPKLIPPAKETRRCVVCGVEFVGNVSKRKKYCSIYCSRIANSNKQKARETKAEE